jgi:hypothetical protein
MMMIVQVKKTMQIDKVMVKAQGAEVVEEAEAAVAGEEEDKDEGGEATRKAHRMMSVVIEREKRKPKGAIMHVVVIKRWHEMPLPQHN